MPKLIRLYITQVLIGFALSAGFVALLLWANVANLAHLITNTSGGYVALLMLWFLNGIVFAGVQFGISIMRLARDDDRPGGGNRDALSVELTEAVPVKITPERHVRQRDVHR
ncbi:hypothetical protein shim_13810 [Shimia sp. SK013]|uniref:hypothetical protein n=1 Tax=Shimia sp. SK013 TaxID=1389006 RepID=UPI0006B60DA9|nr:hypothetical protein [Shimia sp. SK013]KPA23087.1 hypothetical protein shim_13810 [Shimia sp. SK013]